MTIPDKNQIDVVADLEKDLRSEAKDKQESQQSQELGGSGPILPDIANADNNYLKNKVEKYAKVDPIKPTTSILGDFSNLLGQQSGGVTQDNAIARNQMMAMTYSTLANTASQAERVIESQLSYNLAATSFGMNSLSEKSFKSAMHQNKLLDGSFL